MKISRTVVGVDTAKRVFQLGTSKNDAAGVNPDVPCGLPDSGQV